MFRHHRQVLGLTLFMFIFSVFMPLVVFAAQSFQVNYSFSDGKVSGAVYTDVYDSNSIKIKANLSDGSSINITDAIYKNVYAVSDAVYRIELAGIAPTQLAISSITVFDGVYSNSQNKSVVDAVYSFSYEKKDTVCSTDSQISSGYFTSYILKDDCSVWFAGASNSGNVVNFEKVSGLDHVSKIAAGGGHTLVLKQDGTVWSWGSNYNGELGNGSTVTSQTYPQQVKLLDDIIDITAGAQHSLALSKDGTLWAWGRNDFGQLGIGTYDDHTTNYGKNIPVKISSIDHVVQIAAGNIHSLALKDDGTIWSWGQNGNFQLGDGTTVLSRNTPTLVENLTHVTKISAGLFHSLAVKNDGTVWSWGTNFYGQLGDGTLTWRNYPVKVLNLENVASVSSGFHNLALKKDGTIWSWGHNSSGQLGDGTTTDQLTALRVTGLEDVKNISSGAYHSVALEKNGSIWVWGNNAYGQLGDGTFKDSFLPKEIVPGSVEEGFIYDLNSLTKKFDAYIVGDQNGLHLQNKSGKIIGDLYYDTIEKRYKFK
ncbi:hypothetical protein GK047_00910 [Paenibacillus sp. SYP-B3998]|uniref:RCC1-like domain-containing protein n=1 Tax=Paenibacillus sp. SYP-B3998 TaxID=2678564 RepID=A0A6G3ZQV1_9BACL|nr:hypothetical protein [Paenibacillus sp. SYP-B3998]NEW04583.1 hypothetical protein [Paenibacillus sp. SYP-B3998]